MGGGADRWATREFARLKIRVGGSGNSGEGRGAAWALGRRVGSWAGGWVCGSRESTRGRFTFELLFAPSSRSKGVSWLNFG